MSNNLKKGIIGLGIVGTLVVGNLLYEAPTTLTSSTALVKTALDSKVESAPIPVVLGTRSVEVHTDMDEVDVINKNNSFELNVWVSEDGGKTRRYYGGQTWVGGASVGKFGEINKSPILSVGPFDDLAGKALVWIELKPSRGLKIGAKIIQTSIGGYISPADEHHSIAYVGAFGFAQSTGSTGVTTPSRTTTAGNSIIPVLATWIDAGTNATFSDNKSGSYATAVQNTGTGSRAHIGYDHNTAGGTGHTVTSATSASSWQRLNAFEYSGMADQAQEATNTGKATNTSASSGAVTASAGSVTVGMVTHDTTTKTLTLTSSGWTERIEQEDASAGQPINAGDKTSAGASETGTWTIDSSTGWAAAIASFKVAAGAPPTTPPDTQSIYYFD